MIGISRSSNKVYNFPKLPDLTLAIRMNEWAANKTPNYLAEDNVNIMTRDSLIGIMIF
jgi:hypothetical protein